ncbi:MAG: hypothetical protein KGL39_08525 [Patescibacteria group bacterium]|nr:hypothetical protein [Patescibacteria group bacterium]
MKLNKANTQLGVTFNVVEFEPADILAASQNPESLARIVECVNADRRQKVALVDARYDLSQRVGQNDLDGKPFDPPGLGFQRKTKGTGDDVAWDQTENDHIKAFVDAVASGAFTVPDLTLPAGDMETREKAVWAYLQTLADKLGDSIINDGQVKGTSVISETGASVPDGTTCYVLDLARAVRKSGQGPAIPKYALEAADTIIKNGSQEKWYNNFTHGYTAASGIIIDAFSVTDFRHHAPHHATADEKEAVHQANRKALARAIHTARTQENEKTVKQEFA